MENMENMDDSDNEDLVKEYNELRERMNELYEDQKENLFQYIENHNNNNNNNKPTAYSYEAIHELIDTNIENYIDTYDLDEVTINICPYLVNTTAKYPFLQFIMQKNNSEDPYFPDIIKFHGFSYILGMNVMELCQPILDVIFMCYQPNKLLSRQYNYNGFIFSKTGGNNNLYLFFDTTAHNIDSHILYKSNDLYLALIDEIVNHKSMADFPIDPCVTDFFVNNNEFMYLTDKDDFYIESPIVVYSACSRNKMNFTLTFGVSPSVNPTALLGPYYYFTDYTTAIKQDKVVIRSAIFPRNMKVPFNHVDAPPDTSQITQNMLLLGPETTDYLEARNTIRFSDRDALWTESYDSVYIGNLELDNGDFYSAAPLWTIKDCECQTPLTGFIINI